MANNGSFEFKFVNRFPLVRGQIQREMENRVRTATLHLNRKIKMKLASGNRTGHVYKVPGTMHKRYTASAPGEPPAVMTGNLMNHIDWLVSVKTNLISGVVGTNVEYAKRLEFGFVDTDSKGRRYNQAPRPFFRSTFEEERTVIMAILTRRMR